MDDFDLLLGHNGGPAIDDFDELLGTIPMRPNFVIFASYGNDSVALIQWAYREGLKNVVVVYSDTGWAAKMWAKRVEELETWVHTLGFRTARTTSMGFRELALFKKGFPTQRYQWCSYVLKIEPAERWLAENDPDGRSVCLVGVRREEGPDRAEFPRYNLNSNSHGGRVMVAPLADWTEDVRNQFLQMAGVEPLPHRSKECDPCVNAKKRDLQTLAEEDAQKAEDLENELDATHGLTANGKRRTFFRPHRHMGATGVREVIKWANSPRGGYRPPDGQHYSEDAAEAEDEMIGSTGCDAAFCGI